MLEKVSGFTVRDLSFFTGRGGRLFGQNILGWSKGGGQFFSLGQRGGGPEFLGVHEGGQNFFFQEGPDFFVCLRRN